MHLCIALQRAQHRNLTGSALAGNAFLRVNDLSAEVKVDTTSLFASSVSRSLFPIASVLQV